MAIRTSGRSGTNDGRRSPSWRRLSWASIVAIPLLAVIVALILPLAAPSFFITEAQAQQVQRFFDQQQGSAVYESAGGRPNHPQGHTNNWAVLVSASRFWFNYRHMANTLGMYRVVKRLGIPDSQIILMLADDAACDPRNKFPGKIWADSNRALDLYGQEIQVDYKGKEVTVESLIRLLTGRHLPSHPASKRLLSDSASNVFLYMTGHGGEDFLKFQDAEELGAWDLADAIAQMHEKRRYHELLFMIDTCQANSMYSKIYSPNVIAVGSSRVGQNSYSHHTDYDLGIALIDRFTRFVLGYLDGIDKTSDKRLVDLFEAWDPSELHSDPGVRTDLFRSRPLEDVKLTDFFGGRRKGVKITPPATLTRRAAAFRNGVAIEPPTVANASLPQLVPQVVALEELIEPQEEQEALSPDSTAPPVSTSAAVKSAVLEVDTGEQIVVSNVKILESA